MKHRFWKEFRAASATTLPLVIALLALVQESQAADNYSIPHSVISGGGSVASQAPPYAATEVIAQSGPVGRAESGDHTYQIDHGYLVATDLFPNAAFGTGLQEDSHSYGVAWSDIDGDGDWDLFVARGSGGQTQDYVYVNNGNGVLSEVSASKIGTDAVAGFGVAFADYDGDGDLDGYVQNETASGYLWRNDGVSFANMLTEEGIVPITSRMPSWGDFDGDGLVDLVLANDSGNVPALFQNTGNYAIQNQQGFTLKPPASLPGSTQGVAAWADLDNDGFLDLYVAQNADHDLLYINNKDGTFTESSGPAQIDVVTANSQGVAFGDYDLDGYLDIFVSCGGTDNDILWHNNGNSMFTNVAGAAGITDSSDGRSCLWLDVDNDGDLDICVANASSQTDLLYVNNGDQTFRKLPTGDATSSYGCAVADYDNDGDLDIVVTGDSDHFVLYRNECPNHNYIRVCPTDSLGHMTCFGAQVLLYEHDIPTQLAGMVQIDGGSGRGCQSQYDAHFGVPDRTHKYNIEVRFTRNIGGEQVIINGEDNPSLNGVSAGDIDLGRIEVRENGRIKLSYGVAYAHLATRQDIWVAPKSGGDAHQITSSSTGNAHGPSWAPDGQKLVFVSNEFGDQDLFTAAIEDASEAPLVPAEWWPLLAAPWPVGTSETEPAWSSDGAQIAFVSDRDGNREIYVANTAGTETRNLTEDPAEDTSPAWNANSSKIAFATNRVDGDWDVYVMNFDGSAPTPLSDIGEQEGEGEAPYPLQNNGFNDVDPAWHPNGLYLAFSSDRGGGVYQICAMQFDGTLQTAITIGGSDKRHPVFTASGEEIIYESNGQLHIMDFPDGMNDRVLEDAGSGNSGPHYPTLFRQPPRTIVFGTKDGRTMYWADPVNTQLGNYTRSETDFVLPGFGDPVVWSRTYNSQDTMLGPLGYGWRFNYQIAVTEDADGAITVTWGDGTQDFFVWNPLANHGEGAYLPLEDRTTHAFVKNGTDNSYTLTTREGTIFEFLPIGVPAKSYDPTVLGKIKRITDKNGNWTSFAYNEDGLLTNVRQESGRDLVITWNPADKLIIAVAENIVGLTSPRLVQYTYDGNDHLIQVLGKDGVQRTRFEYDGNHRLTDVYTLFDGAAEKHTLHNDYDEDGRVARQRDANGNESTMDYEEADGKLQTTLTDARANTQQHIYDQYRRLVEYRDESAETLQYHYDSDGYKSHVVDRDGNTFRFPQNGLGEPTAAEDPLGNLTEVAYDAGNPIERVVESAPGEARTTAYAYDAQGNLEGVTDNLGKAASVVYNSHGKPIEMHDELGNVTLLFYDPATGGLIKIRNALSHETQMQYDARGRLVKVIDALSHAVEYAYRDDDQLSSVKDANGDFTYFDYYGGGSLKAVRNALGHESVLTYDDNLNVKTATDPRGHTVTYDYDPNNNVVKVSDTYQGAPREFNYVYDAQNRLVSATNPLGHTVQYAYDVHGRVTAVTDARGQQYHTEYDEAGRKTSTWTELDGNRLETLYAYNNAGELIQTTLMDPLGPKPAGIVTSFEYDGLGRLVKTTDDAGHQATTEYYAASETGAFYGAVKRTVSVNGRETTYEYDAIGRRVNAYDAIGRRTHYEYDNAGRLISLDTGPTSPSAPFTTRYEYDANGNAVKIIRPAGDVLETRYDALNRPVRVYLPYPEGGTRDAYTQYTYDEAGQTGRLTRVIDPEGHETHYVYDEDGRVLTTTDAKGNVVESTYDLLGRVVKMVSAKSTPDQSEVQYEYDANSNRTKVAKIMETPEKNQEHRFEYDLLNRNTRYTDPLGRQTTMAYDLVGTLKRHETADGLVTTYEYDSLYRIARVNYPDGSNATRAYDSAHPLNLLSVANSALGTTSWTYDDADRMASVTDKFGKTVGYAYDHFNRVRTLLYPGALAVAYTYNNRHQIASVIDWLGNSASYAYDGEGRLLRQDNSNGTATTYEYYANGWLKKLENTGPSGVIASYSLATDAVGNRTQIVRNEPLLPFATSDSTSSTFDKANQIQTDGEATYSFDQRGNLTNEVRGAGTITYQYDYANRLVGVVSGTPATYTYDDSGNRVAAVRSGDETRYTLDTRGMGWVVSENDASNALEWLYVYANGLVWRVNATTNETQTYHGDYIGSVAAITDGSGQSVQAYSFDAYGEVDNCLSSVEQPFQYAGVLGVQQEQNGLKIMRARFYETALGAFLGTDPVFAVNPYAYSMGNPLSYTDPRGLHASADGFPEYNETEDWCTFSPETVGTVVTREACYNHDKRYMFMDKDAADALLVYEIWDNNGRTLESLAVAMIYFAGVRTPVGDLAYERAQAGHKLIDIDAVSQSIVKTGAFGRVTPRYGTEAILQTKEEKIGYGYRLPPQMAYSDQVYSTPYTLMEAIPGSRIVMEETANQITYRRVPVEPPKPDWSGIDASLNAQAEWQAQQRARMVEQYQRREAEVRAQIDAFTGGGGWEAMAGNHGLTYTDVAEVGRSFLTGFWYTNVSRIANMFIPGAREEAAQKALSAHAALVNTVRLSLLQNYGMGSGANGRNTPFIPEVYQIEVVEGKTRAFTK